MFGSVGYLLDTRKFPKNTRISVRQKTDRNSKKTSITEYNKKKKKKKKRNEEEEEKAAHIKEKQE